MDENTIAKADAGRILLEKSITCRNPPNPRDNRWTCTFRQQMRKTNRNETERV
jgi:hypothetical protein